MSKLVATQITKKMQDALLEYINTAFWTKDASFNKARGEYIREKDGSVFREPLFEVLPRYESSGKKASEHSVKLGIFADAKESDCKRALAFLDRLAPNPLYSHQARCLGSILEPGVNLAITTGTGSGKTISFLLPVLGSILRESLGLGGRRIAWVGSGAPSEKIWYEQSDRKFALQRSKFKRIPAMRAMFVFPLNALVQDQVENLRKVLDSNEAESFYRDSLGGERIYFGQYNSSTWGRGDFPKNTQDDRARREECAELLFRSKTEAEESAGISLETIHRIPSPGKSELLTRWDIQKTPPDILITNYSMLSLMLVRDRETEIFESTRKWLDSNPENVFHFVVDEAHAYRGTAGTEISFIFKTFFERLGRKPGDPQIKIIATSASLEGGVNESSDAQFLTDFFGTPSNRKCFSLVSGTMVSFPPGGILNVSKFDSELEEFGHSEKLDSDVFKVLEKIRDKAGLDGDVNGSILRRLNFEGAILEASSAISGMKGLSAGTRAPLSVADIQAVFRFKSEVAAEGLVDLLSSGSNLLEGYYGQLRLHIFIRNIPGIATPIGSDRLQTEQRLLYEPTTTICPVTQKITLEVCYCQQCGEIFHGGRLYSIGSKKFIGIESSPLADRSEEYGVFFQCKEKIDLEGWRKVWVDPYSGWISNNEIAESVSGWFLDDSVVSKKPKVNSLGLPFECPVCETNWKTRVATDRSVFGRMGTGQHKVSQIIAEELLEVLSKGTKTPPKLVVFSDSRKSAATISAELDLNHHRDTLRAYIIESIQTSELQKGEDPILEWFERCEIAKSVLKPIPYSGFRSKKLFDFVEFFQNLDDIDFSPSVEKIFIDYKKRSSRSYVELDRILNGYLERMRSSGRCPVFVPPKPFNGVDWTAEIFDGEGLDTYSVGMIRREISSKLQTEVLRSIGAGLGRDIEALGLGWLTYKGRDDLPELEREVVDVLLRFLVVKPICIGEDGYEFTYFPAWYSKRVREKYNLSPDFDLKALVLGRVCKTVGRDLILDFSKLAINLKSGPGFECSKCGTLHMFRSRFCRRVRNLSSCDGELVALKDGDAGIERNYYLRFMKEGHHLRALRTEEVTGQTDKEDQRARQLAFQDVFFGEPTKRTQDVEKLRQVYGIDLLSVTTTMEAGVDIGELKAVLMANMPPKRFNYQQRVGRAARRGDRLGIAVTFCKNRSHDDYYFYQNLNIISDLAPNPSIQVYNKDIFRRVLLKHFLFEAFRSDSFLRSSVEFAEAEGDVNSGRFGSLGTFCRHEEYLLGVFAKVSGSEFFNRFQEAVYGSVAFEGKEFAENLKSLFFTLKEVLAKKKYASELSVSEVLLLEGHLPLFGMPNRNVALVHSNPNEAPNIRRFPLERGFISRSADTAISEYLIGNSVTKDKHTFKVVGLGRYAKLANRVEGVELPYRSLWICQKCEALFETRVQACEICDSPIALKEFKGISPEVYVCDFRMSEAYDGLVSSSRAPVITFPLFDNQVISGIESFSNFGFRVSGAKGRILRCNLNSGTGFSLERDGGTEPNLKGLYRELGTGQSKFALYSEKKTDILIVQAEQWNEDLIRIGEKNPIDALKLKSAWVSAAEILARALTKLEDLEPGEVEPQIKFDRILTESGSLPMWSILISDRLDNGAGFAANFSKKMEFERLLDFVLNNYAKKLLDHRHSDKCSDSCYFCLRHFGNSQIHELLNWRLGLTLLRGLSSRGDLRVLDPELLGGLFRAKIEKDLIRAFKRVGIADARLDQDHGGVTGISKNGMRIRATFKSPFLHDSALEASQDEVAVRFCPYLMHKFPLRQEMFLRQRVSQLT